MYAVIASGGKQYRVALGDTIKVEKIDLEAGANLEFDQVLLLANGEDIQIGTPYLKTEKVGATVVNQGRHKKIDIVKFRRRKHHMKTMGHRQDYTEVKITKIGSEVLKPKAEKAAPKSSKKTADKAENEE